MFTLNNIIKNADQTGYFAESYPCPTCNYTATVFVSPQQLFVYNQGGYAHDVLDNYPADVRERFISGYCGECWNDLFAGFDEDED